MRRAAIAMAVVLILAAAGCSSSPADDNPNGTTKNDAPVAVGSGMVAPGSEVTPTIPTPPLDGGTYTTASAIETALVSGGQDCSHAHSPGLSDFTGATDADQCTSPGAVNQDDTTIVVFTGHDQAASYARDIVVAVADLPPNTTAVLGVNWALSTTSSTYAQTAQKILGGTILDPQAAPSPTPAATQAPEQVTYACTGHGSVNITYGPNGSQHSAYHLPFSHTDPLTQGALYYATTAQLQGGGSVSCTTTVQTDDLLGYAQTVDNTGSADGGYNIATAEVCSGINGWEKC